MQTPRYYSLIVAKTARGSCSCALVRNVGTRIESVQEGHIFAHVLLKQRGRPVRSAGHTEEVNSSVGLQETWARVEGLDRHMELRDTHESAVFTITVETMQ